jgi:hypothetical protein
MYVHMMPIRYSMKCPASPLVSCKLDLILFWLWVPDSIPEVMWSDLGRI